MPTYLTPEKLEAMKAEFEERQKITRREIAERIAEATALGDLSENFEYQTAKDEQGLNETRIQNLRNMIQDSVLIDASEGGTEVTIGSTFDVTVGGTEKTFRIVGSNEANPIEGRISNESPLGQQFLGKAEDDVIDIDVPSGTMSYTIKKIH
jgi:transcription elongation factor GreA